MGCLAHEGVIVLPQKTFFHIALAEIILFFSFFHANLVSINIESVSSQGSKIVRYYQKKSTVDDIMHTTFQESIFLQYNHNTIYN